MKMLILIVVSTAIFVLLAIGAWRVIRDTIRARGKWGVNFRNMKCPDCEALIRVAVPRIPATGNQMLWGGWNCRQCGCQIDKWGNPRDP